MAIDNTGFAQCIKQNHQMSNLWEFFFDDDSGAIEFNVQSVSLPQKMIEQEMLGTGEHTFKGTTKIDTFSIEVRETTDFKVSKYFNNWWNEIYDDSKQQFKVVKGIDKRYKNAYFSFLSSQKNPVANLALAAGAIGQATAIGASALGSSAVSRGANEVTKRIVKSYVDKAFISKETRLYAFENCRLLGKGEVTPTVDSTEPLTWSYDFTFTGYSPLVEDSGDKIILDRRTVYR